MTSSRTIVVCAAFVVFCGVAASVQVEIGSSGAVPVDLWFCNAISYQNTKYVFEFDDQGITTRYLR